MAGMDATATLRRVREAAHCARSCGLGGVERDVMPVIRFTHNGVSFSRQVDVDCFLMVTDVDGAVAVLAAWCREHHAGRDGREVMVERAGEKFYMQIPEAVG